jgi:hypothetical protein
MAIQGMEQPLLLPLEALEPEGVLAMTSAQATPEVRDNRVKVFIITFLIIVIVRILCF